MPLIDWVIVIFTGAEGAHAGTNLAQAVGGQRTALF